MSWERIVNLTNIKNYTPIMIGSQSIKINNTPSTLVCHGLAPRWIRKNPGLHPVVLRGIGWGSFVEEALHPGALKFAPGWK